LEVTIFKNKQLVVLCRILVLNVLMLLCDLRRCLLLVWAAMLLLPANW
jgi:hypothetical protein